MCKFNVTNEGIRNGLFYCYKENGEYRHTGYFRNDIQLKDSLKVFND